MIWQSAIRKIATLCTLMIATGLTVTAENVSAASLLLPNGEPDPNCPELRLWLRADSGIKDAEGRDQDDPNFDGNVVAWQDRSPHKFDVGAAPQRAPRVVARQPAAGNQPTVFFEGQQILTRANSALYDRPCSAVVLVARGRSKSHSGNVYSAGRNPARETLQFIVDNDILRGVIGKFMSTTGPKDFFFGVGSPPTGAVSDGQFGARFAAIISSGQFDRRCIEYHDGLGSLLEPDRQKVLAPAASDRCHPDFYLGGDEESFFTGEIAEMIVFNRDLSRDECRNVLQYVRRRYGLDMTDRLLPPGTFLRTAASFEGNWLRCDQNQGLRGGPTVSSDGKPAEKEGIVSTFLVPHEGTYHVWIRAQEHQGPGRPALKTVVQGKELGVTHFQGNRSFVWRKAGDVELKAGPADIVICGEGPGRKDCDAVLVSPTVDTPDAVEDLCALAQRVRGMGGESRLKAVFEDGSRLEGSLLAGWRSVDASGKAVRDDLAARSPLICLQFDSCVEKAAAGLNVIVELHNGDRLRGVISGYEPGSSANGQAASARLLIGPPQGFPLDRETFSVDVDWVRRIVFESSSRDRRCPPQGLICRNGRTYSFRAVRWSDQSLSLLTDDGVERVPILDVEELRTAAVNAWDKYYQELSAGDPEMKADIIRLETPEGLSLTASTNRTSLLINRPDPVPWGRLIHPVWSRYPIKVPWANTRLIWQAPAHLVPLSRFAPEQIKERGPLGQSWRSQLDRNVLGGNLSSGGLEYFWGFGVHGSCEMVFQLPDCARSLRTSVGIDSAVGRGGCVIAKVYANQATGTPLYTSKPLVGMAPAAFTGEIELPATSGDPRKVVLVTESAGDLRCENGDPLDIGDHVDWLEPILLLDPAKLRAEVHKRSTK